MGGVISSQVGAAKQRRAKGKRSEENGRKYKGTDERKRKRKVDDN